MRLPTRDADVPPAAIRRLCLAGAGLCGAVIVAGRWGVPRWSRHDRQISRWMLAHRTPALNLVSGHWTWLTDTGTVVAATTAAFVGLRLRLGRWREPAIVVTSVTGQLVIFLISARVIQRPRPAIKRLGWEPPTSSYPSGHTSAGMALYGSLAGVALSALELPRPAQRVVRCWWVIPVLVGTSRVYRGMHHPSDVVAGAISGGSWTYLVLRTLSR